MRSNSGDRSLIPYSVLVISMLMTFSVSAYLARIIDKRDEAAFTGTVQEARAVVEDRLRTYASLLRGAAGLFASQEQLNAADFRRYVDRLFIEANYPGIQGLGFARRVDPQQLDSLQRSMRQQGDASFHIWPEGQREVYFPIVYLEPLDRRNQAAIGYDMFSEPVRREAMQRARDEGRPAASGRVLLVQEIDVRKQPGFLVYCPVYRGGGIPGTLEQRRERLEGFTYSPFRAVDLLTGILGSEMPNLRLQVYDGLPADESSLLYDSEPTQQAWSPHFQSSTRIEVAGRPWTLSFTTRPGYDPSSRRLLVGLALGIGTTVSLLLFGVTRSLARSRLSAEAMARELRDSAAALRHSEERTQLALEAGQIGTWEWDVQSAIVRWSESLERIMGMPAGGLGGSLDDFLKLVHPEDVARVRQRIDQTLSGGGDYSLDFRVNHPDGSIHWIEAAGRAFGDGADRPRRLVGVMRDATDWKRIETDLIEARETAEVARVEAERANRLKDDFLATISHELRTPLNAMLGWAQLLRAGSLDTETSTEAIEAIERNAKAQAQLIEDLLDLSRIIRGKLQLEMEPVDLPPVIEAAIASVTPSANANGIALQRQLDREVGPVLGDPTRIQQIVWNLLSNAVKFTPRGGSVRVMLHRDDDKAIIVVSDTGRGISSDFLPYVFDRFRQADASTTRRQGGLGLGLAIVRHLIEQHGGTVEAASEGPGKGSTFTVRLPLVADAVAAVRRRTGEDGESEPPVWLGGRRVLVVDDEADARRLLETILRRHGAEVRTADSAPAALVALDEFRPDVLLSDISMPGEDGYELLHKIRQRTPERGGRIPAAALTAYARREDRLRAIAAGFQTHLPKPIEPAELVNVVANLTNPATGSAGGAGAGGAGAGG